jgi:hypothetical protein
MNVVKIRKESLPSTFPRWKSIIIK